MDRTANWKTKESPLKVFILQILFILSSESWDSYSDLCVIPGVSAVICWFDRRSAERRYGWGLVLLVPLGAVSSGGRRRRKRATRGPSISST